METAKTGSKLAQLQALRGQKQRRQTLGQLVHELHSSPRTLALEAKIAELEAEIKQCRAENLRLKTVTSPGNVSCPKCEAARRATARRQKKWKAKQKR